MANILWKNDVKTHSVFLALCEGNPPVTGGCRDSNADLWCFPWCSRVQLGDGRFFRDTWNRWFSCAKTWIKLATDVKTWFQLSSVIVNFSNLAREYVKKMPFQIRKSWYRPYIFRNRYLVISTWKHMKTLRKKRFICIVWIGTFVRSVLFQ